MDDEEPELEEVRKAISKANEYRSVYGERASPGPDFRSLFETVIQRGRVHCVRLMIEAKAQLNCSDMYHMLPLGYAVHHNRPDLVKLLLDAKADPTRRDGYSRTALQVAASKQRLVCVQLLCQAMDPAMIDFYESVSGSMSGTQTETALAIAVWRGDFDIADVLMSAGADPALVQHEFTSWKQHLEKRARCRSALVVLYGVMRRRLGVCRNMCQHVAPMVWALRRRPEWIAPW